MSVPSLRTEGVDEAFVDIDEWPVERILAGLLDHQVAAIEAVRRALPQLAVVVERAAPRLAAGGRLVYVGAGTSGRLGTQDGVELTPTYSWPPSRVLSLMAGGDGAFLRSVEGAEDDATTGAARAHALGPTAQDVFLGIAASGTTPFVIAALATARRVGALTVGIACNPGAPLLEAGECGVLLDTGPEAVAGSTRLKAGTAQKAALNLLSTTLMIRLGRVYRGLMVEMQATNAKLRRRAVRMLMRLARCGEPEALRAMDAAGGDLKVAILMTLDGIARDEAVRRLAAAGGLVRRARSG
ncbi:MAG: N-acetylmuramic acid 6-phosphate etherase [Alphaproteobacteria bacterium]|nr:N-acetylmuramic acid 6-phosphate etherase [Alphaproteobacteria bacterium]